MSGREKQLQSCRKSGFVIPVVLMLSFLLVSGCGIYAFDLALMAPYNLSIGLDELTFYGDDEELLDGYNLWYKEGPLDTYERCYYDTKLNTPTILKKGGAADQYTVDMKLLSPLGGDSFREIYDDDNETTFYFAVSAYGTGIAESGKAGFGLWP